MAMMDANAEAPKTDGDEAAAKAPLTPKSWLAPVMIVVIALGIRVPQLAQPGFPVDTAQFIAWGGIAQSQGVSAVYESRPAEGQAGRPCNIPPLHIHIFRFLADVHAFVSNGARMSVEVADDVACHRDTDRARIAIVLFKLPALIADIATALLLWQWLSQNASQRLGACAGIAYAANPVIWYDSAVWGQVDAVHTLFMVLSLRAAAKRGIVAMSAWAALGILTKAQSIVLLPVWVVAWWQNGRGLPARRRLVKLAIPVVAAAAVALPFVATLGKSREAAWREAYLRASGYYPYLHLNAFNLWFLVNPIDAPSLSDLSAYERDDILIIPGVTHRRIGLALLALAAVVVSRRLWRTLSGTSQVAHSKGGHACGEFDAGGAVFRAGALLALAFFVVSTQMHERYIYPAVALWAFGGLRSRHSWVAWLTMSAAGFLNMLWAWSGPPQSVFSRLNDELFLPGRAALSIGFACAGALVLLLLLEIATDLAVTLRRSRATAVAPIMPRDEQNGHT